ncbi:MAG: hypothetical protein LBE18_00160 [Planctomycetaceae bacterium]|jgi:hypothetical protein|nr:hypothetical protein [Planctomycetaceae bacterium]
MSKIENFVPEKFVSPNVSLGFETRCGNCECDNTFKSPNCQNVKMLKWAGGGG